MPRGFCGANTWQDRRDGIAHQLRGDNMKHELYKFKSDSARVPEWVLAVAYDERAGGYVATKSHGRVSSLAPKLDYLIALAEYDALEGPALASGATRTLSFVVWRDEEGEVEVSWADDPSDVLGEIINRIQVEITRKG
jgi:hypothetical protein